MFKHILENIKDTAYRIVRSRLFVLMIVFCIMFVVLVNRVFYLQIVKGQYYLDNYKLKIRKVREITGTRGNIYDRNGQLLAYNELAYSVIIEDNIRAASLNSKNKELNAILERVMSIVEAHGDAIINDFGIVLDSAGNYTYAYTSEILRLRFLADIYGYRTIEELSDDQSSASAETVVEYLCTDDAYGYGLDFANPDRAYLLKMINMRYAIGLNSFQQYIPTTLAFNVSDETAAAISENRDTLNGVDIAEDSMRRYVDSQYFASIIGYTGKISLEEYNALDPERQKHYSKTDIIGKSGLEQAMEEVLQGQKGMMNFYVDSVGKVTDTVSVTAPAAGNNVYLTIDKDLQINTYKLLEEKLAGIVLSKLSNVMNYDPSLTKDASEIIIPADDAYNAFIANEIISSARFAAPTAGPAEQALYAAFSGRRAEMLTVIGNELNNPGAAAYKDLSAEMKAIMDYISITLLINNTEILMRDQIDTADPVYQAWTNEETINFNQYLNYAISQNWIDTAKLGDYISTEKYSDSTEVFQGILQFIMDDLDSDSYFDKLLYKYLIKSGSISGGQIFAAVYEQGVLPMDEGTYHGLLEGSVDPFAWLSGKISTLEITPGQLALEPCTGSAVVSDPNTGEVLACVSYPGYDNNRLANTMDSQYYNKLVTGLSRPFYNNATQERTAPGSTYKMVSAVAGLTEGVMDTQTLFGCFGPFEKVTPSPVCWIYPLGSHGHLNVVGAIEVSCNDYFYEVGYQLGMDKDGQYDSELGVEKLAKYAKAFGLGEKTGLEIPESPPQISDSYSVQSAIGQGTNNYTVSQLNRYVAAVANRGTVHNLSLLNKTTDSNGKLIKNYEPKTAWTMDKVSDQTWDAVQQGMVGMIADNASFTDLGISMAGKTGTAQQSAVHPDHALFVGYVPADHPELALAIRIANGYKSSYAAEVGRDIVRLKYNLADVNQLITGSAASLGVPLAGD